MEPLNQVYCVILSLMLVLPELKQCIWFEGKQVIVKRMLKSLDIFARTGAKLVNICTY